jgi:predicted O-linked N-acetylglucosamine transferase (SPINDLY family)
MNLFAHVNIASLFDKKGEVLRSVKYYEKAHNLDPENAEIFAHLSYQRRKICLWSEDYESSLKVNELGLTGRPITPFILLPFETDPEKSMNRAIRWAEKYNKKSSGKFALKLYKKSRKIRVGYVSGEFHEHPVSYLIKQVFQLHNRKEFEVYAYSYGTKRNDSVRTQIKASVDHFKYIGDLTDDDAIAAIRKDEIDIAIDLTGYTANNRAGIFSKRVANVQINYLGFPGTMGSAFMDYIIADDFLIPDTEKHFYSEKIIYLPNQYQAQNNSLKFSEKLCSRAILGLPENSFVYCAINNSYKISPEVFSVWMRVLKKTDNAVLWLLETNREMKENLYRESIKYGVRSDRLLFTKYKPHDEYLEQFRHADLYLDTFDYNAGATASNALWAGLPVVTKVGRTYTSRMAGSLLNSLGMYDSITHTNAEYEQLAVNLAQNPVKCFALKAELSKNLSEKPLFDSVQFTIHFEYALKKALKFSVEDKPPSDIVVPQKI